MRMTFRAALIALMLVPTGAPAQDYNKGLDAYSNGDFVTALKEWRPLAEMGRADAQSNLGHMYESGKGVPQDKAEAVKWYRLAAEQGYPEAQLNLGYMYFNGTGVPQDFVAAIMWWNIAMFNGEEKASENIYTMGLKLTDEDNSEAFRRALVCVESEYKDCD